MTQIFQFFILVCVSLFLSKSFAFRNYEKTSDFPGAADEVGKLPLIDFAIPFHHYSGYLDSIEDIKLHYWFFESMNKPKTDPVVLWLNGGPGCSSLYGAFTENGPLRANRNGTFTLNPFSWSRNASLLYLETPVFVGFSFNRTGVQPLKGTDNRTMAQNFAALQSFFTTKFPYLASNPFYITGESYAGHYIPQLSVELLKQKFPPNFKGVAIGNGFFDFSLMQKTAKLYSSTHAIFGLYGVVNEYNILADCYDEAQNPSDVCSGIAFLTSWLNRADVQRAIHISSSSGQIPVHWQLITDISYNTKSGSMAEEVKKMVDEGLMVVIYNGDLDEVCDFISDQLFVEQLGYVQDNPPVLTNCTMTLEGGEREKSLMKKMKKRSSYSSKKGGGDGIDDPNTCSWRVGDWNKGVTVIGGIGQTFHSGRLVFLTVRGAGHMVPFDKPAAALTLFNEFLLKIAKM